MDDQKPGVNRRRVLQALGAGSVVGLAGCSGGDGGDGSDGESSDGGSSTPTATSGEGSDGGGGMDSVSAAFAYLTLPGDHGWTFQHNEAATAVDEKFDWLEVSTVEEVSNDDMARVSQELAQQNDIVFGTSFGYMDAMFNTAEENPDTIFEHCAGFRSRENMGRYFGHMDQVYFLAGIAAGMTTETNQIGFLAAYPIAEIIRFINAFALGVGMENDEAEVKLRWMNTWFDPPKSKQAANSLMDENCDVITSSTDSPAHVEAATAQDNWSIGANSPMSQWGGEKYITSVVYNWEPFYTETLQNVREGTWEADFDWWGLEKDAIRLDDWGPNVSSEIQNTVDPIKEEFVNGDRTIWQGTQFEGESEQFLFQEMGTLVDNVAGEVPS